MEVIVSLTAATLSMFAGGLASSKLLRNLIKKIFNIPEQPVSYSERLSTLTSKLAEASGEVDDLVKEIATVAVNRQNAVASLENELSRLEITEADLRERIMTLENTPVEAARHFAAIVSEGEKRSAKRDYMLFGAGVLLSTVVSIVIQFLVFY